MQIDKDKVVSFHYRLSSPEFGLIEDSHDGEPLLYMHGHGGLIAGLEAAMVGHNAGDSFSVTLAPEQAYGPRNENAVQRISKSHVIGSDKRKPDFHPGMMVQVNTNSGPRSVIVIKVGLKTLDVDANHPLAGRTLSFDVDVVDVREASAEEIAHGHAHGAGGHQH
ncbi:MAG: peptidylprolyl isomerase [Chromatiales bacterium]|jgi:FKBP-type peptidyl-prolyl cis-trans isomerase SlyD|nr:peptidylprolyl isomerase [Chromatiales bacterium]